MRQYYKWETLRVTFNALFKNTIFVHFYELCTIYIKTKIFHFLQALLVSKTAAVQKCVHTKVVSFNPHLYFWKVGANICLHGAVNSKSLHWNSYLENRL